MLFLPKFPTLTGWVTQEQNERALAQIRQEYLDEQAAIQEDYQQKMMDLELDYLPQLDRIAKDTRNETRTRA